MTWREKLKRFFKTKKIRELTTEQLQKRVKKDKRFNILVTVLLLLFMIPSVGIGMQLLSATKSPETLAAISLEQLKTLVIINSAGAIMMYGLVMALWLDFLNSDRFSHAELELRLREITEKEKE